jgi:anti-sigma regulatory factor (Ser/Thr protein kinase)
MSASEAVRLAALRRYRILDTEPEKAFDDLVMLASQICGTPIALISLVDADRQWFKARIGVTVTETARSISFCSHAIEQPTLFVVRDATSDERFRENPLVTAEPCIRFYAGSPLVTDDGEALGTLCVLDRVPRTLTADQEMALEALKRQVLAQMELRRNLHELAAALEERDRAEADQAHLVVELRDALEHVQHLSALLPYCSTCELNLTVPAIPSSIAVVTEGVMRVIRAAGQVSEEKLIQIELALQEALANAIRHGCKGDPNKQVQCCVSCDDSGEVLIVVRDPGPGFDPAAVPHPLEERNLLKSSGRGIFLINELMDEVRFADRGRELAMRKAGRKSPSEPTTPAGCDVV